MELPGVHFQLLRGRDVGNMGSEDMRGECGAAGLAHKEREMSVGPTKALAVIVPVTAWLVFGVRAGMPFVITVGAGEMDLTVGKALAWYTTDPDSIPGIPCGAL